MAAQGGPWRGYLLAAVMVVVVLATTNTWNPFPGIWAWLNTSKPIAAGTARWQQHIGGSPQDVAIAGPAAIVSYRTSVEAYGLVAGVRLWGSDADWAAVAGQGADAVVVTGRLLTRGYQVLDPYTGAVRRSDSAATAVWTYADAVLDLHCAKADDCELTAWDPRASRPRWTVRTGGIGFVLNAANPDLPDTRQDLPASVDDHVSGPRPLPGLIGLPVDGKVRVINTAAGAAVRTVSPGAGQRAVVTGNRVLTITGTAGDGTCYYAVAAADLGGQRVWRRDGLNLRTAGTSCRQDRDPTGGQDVLLGVDSVGRQKLVAAHDGRVLWHGDNGDTVVAVDDAYAVIRNSAGLRAFSFERGTTAWRRAGGPDGGAALTPYASILVGSKPARIVAVDPRTGAVRLDVRTDAKVFAVDAGGVIVVRGRDMAYLPLR